jgi:hypothetical protein
VPWPIQFAARPSSSKTTEPLLAADIDSHYDVYERSAGTTKRVSKGPVGGNAAYAASLQGLSADGGRLFFYTAEQLTTDDTDTSGDAYKLRDGVTFTVNGNGAFGASFLDASADGSRVLFRTTESLSSRDTDGQSDRLGGRRTDDQRANARWGGQSVAAPSGRGISSVAPGCRRRG